MRGIKDDYIVMVGRVYRRCSSFTVLVSKITNPVELAAAQAALDFLNRLLAGQVVYQVKQ